MKEINQKYGLSFKGEKQIKGSFVFESPVILSNTTCKNVKMGAFSYFGQDCDIRKVEIGRFCSIAQRVSVSPVNHPLDRFSTHLVAFSKTGKFLDNEQFQKMAFDKSFSKSSLITKIGNDVWIGDGAIIMSGVKIGDGAVIGARSVVTKDVGDYEIVAGAPAKLIRKRFPEDIISRLKKLKWWNYDFSDYKEQIDVSDINQTLSVLENLVYENKLPSLKTKKYTIKNKVVAGNKNQLDFIEVDKS